MLAVKTLKSDSNIIRHAAWLMGNQFEISVVANDTVLAGEQINAAIGEINRVEKLLSGLTENSKVNEINRNAGIKPVKVSAEIYRLIDRAIQIAQLTYGTFDISYFPADGDNDKALSTHNNYQHIILDPKNVTVYLREKGMRISLAALSKGYAADRAKYVLQLAGVHSGVINAGGQLLTWGAQPDNEPWTIASADAEQAAHPHANFNISNMCIATTVDPDRLAAINNPYFNYKQGFPVSGITSVSIISPTAELSGALAGPIMAMGVNASLYLVNKLNQIACVIVDDHNRVYTSKGIK